MDMGFMLLLRYAFGYSEIRALGGGVERPM
jgi:hypothetical protein